MDKKFKIVVADDHPLLRQGLRQMIEFDTSFEIVGEAGDGETALRLIEDHRPNLVILDIDMPRLGGFDVVRELQKRKIETDVIFLTMHSREEIFQTAMDLGVKGYVLKDSASTDIVAGIKAVAAGHSFISPALTSLLLGRRQRSQNLRREKPSLELLTPTERRVLKLIADDKTSKEIGEELFISYQTVNTHRANIAKKLDLHGNLALVKFALINKSEF
jgi:DNA-binding NarL/FixJ family response regulator